MSNTTENQIEIVLIRHGKTEGNKQKQYIGRTDQFLRKEKQKSEAAAIQALKKYMQVPCFGQDRQQH